VAVVESFVAGKPVEAETRCGLAPGKVQPCSGAAARASALQIRTVKSSRSHAETGIGRGCLEMVQPCFRKYAKSNAQRLGPTLAMCPPHVA
jgi:hypothetical protein